MQDLFEYADERQHAKKHSISTDINKTAMRTHTLTHILYIYLSHSPTEMPSLSYLHGFCAKTNRAKRQRIMSCGVRNPRQRIQTSLKCLSTALMRPKSRKLATVGLMPGQGFKRLTMPDNRRLSHEGVHEHQRRSGSDSENACFFCHARRITHGGLMRTVASINCQ